MAAGGDQPARARAGTPDAPPTAATVALRFVEEFGRRPEVAWAAPGRVNLIGEHTDYNGGFVLPFALPLRTAVAAARRPGGMVTLRSRQRPEEAAEVEVDHLSPGPLPAWASYAAGVLWALAGAGHRLGGADLLVDGDVPIGAGLASSAALEAGVAAAVNALFGLGIPARQLAGLCVRAENDFVGMPCGVMDQLAAFECRAGAVLLIDARSLATEHVPLQLDAAGLRLLVIDTRVRHELAGTEYAERRRQCERAAGLLGVASLRDSRLDDVDRLDGILRARARHVLTENDRVCRAVGLLRSGRVAEVGPILDDSHRSLREDYQVSSAELDLAVDSARAAGALGARMTGGGFGGCAIALAGAGTEDDIRRRVAAAFAQAGLERPSVFPVAPSGGAAPLDARPA